MCAFVCVCECERESLCVSSICVAPAVHVTEKIGKAFNVMQYLSTPPIKIRPLVLPAGGAKDSLSAAHPLLHCALRRNMTATENRQYTFHTIHTLELTSKGK